jgi:hypothetical protein
MPAAQRSGTPYAFRPRLSAMVAMDALGLGLLIAPAGSATADPATPTAISPASRKHPTRCSPSRAAAATTSSTTRSA